MKQNSIKFKYIPFSPQVQKMYNNKNNIITSTEDDGVVDNPIGIEDLPSGEYMIRGNKQYHRKTYFKIHNIWFLVDETTKDNSFIEIIKFNLLPCLTKGEWDIISKVGIKKLSPIWRKYLLAYEHQTKLRNFKQTGYLSI